MASALVSEIQPGLHFTAGESGWTARFSCFASPCEVLLGRCPRALALTLVQEAFFAARRVEARYSRYRPESWLGHLHSAAGEWVETDEELEGLLDVAQAAWQLSSGRFDISSGVLRRVWSFHEGALPPSREQLEPVLALVGWQRVERRPGTLRLPPQMELDLGGIGKEFAVDRVADLVAPHAPGPWLVNFGGDLRAGGLREEDAPWRVGLDDPRATGDAMGTLELRHGALATSGDARRFLLHRGKRLGHILDARTGWPPPGAARSVTVAAPTCTEAGILATVGLLMGRKAEAWLAASGRSHWVLR